MQSSKIYLSAEIQEDVQAKVTINGPANKVLVLLEEEAVAIFNSLKDAGRPDTLEVMCLFFKNIAERVFDDDL